jgi:putative acetyltransferase
MTDRQNLQADIKPYEEKFREQILSVWERSVLATHDFLSPADFSSIKEIVHTIDFRAFDVYCLTQEYIVIGFLGVAEKKVEMLFLDPIYFGQGLGKKLMDFALTELKADKVDVNEQNSNAVKFYEKLGFEIYERTEKDDQGKDYPLLRMKLQSQNI